MAKEKIKFTETQLKVAEYLVKTIKETPNLMVSYKTVSEKCFNQKSTSKTHNGTGAQASGKVLFNVNTACQTLGLPLISTFVVNDQTGIPKDEYFETYMPNFKTATLADKKEFATARRNEVLACEEWDKLVEYIREHQ